MHTIGNASDDSRVSVGQYLAAAYSRSASRERLSIEQAMFVFSGTRGERIKQMLAGCLPLALIETPEMKEFRAALDNDGGAMAKRAAHYVHDVWWEHSTRMPISNPKVSRPKPDRMHRCARRFVTSRNYQRKTAGRKSPAR